MIINTRDMATTGPVEVVEELSFSISREEADEEFAMEVMSAQLYSDKLKIIAQEYLSNARDAHREAGIAAEAVKVHLPTNEEPWYEVSDRGNGISRKNFTDIFMKYFASTKRGVDNNSKRQNGGFGLGAKSAWTYAPEFFVTTINDGVEYRYHCYRNLEKKRKAALLSISRIGKDEHNGTTVRIGIKSEDIVEFNGKFRDITLLWGVKPKIVNFNQDFFYRTFSRSDIIYEDSETIVFERNRGTRNSLTALVDDIPYPIDIRVIGEYLTNEERKFALSAAAYIHCDKLEVDPTPNRENLEYNNRTRDYLISKIKSVYSSVKNIAHSKISAADNYWKACCIWYSDESIKSLRELVELPKFNDISLPESTDGNIYYENTYMKRNERTSVFYVNFLKRVDGTVTVQDVSNITYHRFDQKSPIVFQVGGSPEKCYDKLVTLYNNIVNSNTNNSNVVGFNLVRLPSESNSLQKVIQKLEEKYNWEKIFKYDLSKVTISHVGSKSTHAKTEDVFYIIDDDIIQKVSVDFNGKYDIYVPIKNKKITILGKSYRFDSPDVKNFKRITGIDFSQVNIYAIPHRFINKMVKIKTMRSLDDAIIKSFESIKGSIDTVVNKYKNGSTIRMLLAGTHQHDIKELYKIIHSHIDDNSVFSRVAKIISSNYGILTHEENLIVWYLRETQNLKIEENETEEIRQIRDLIKNFNDNYNPLLEIINIYKVPYDNRRIQIIVNMVNTIERNIAAVV